MSPTREPARTSPAFASAGAPASVPLPAPPPPLAADPTPRPTPVAFLARQAPPDAAGPVDLRRDAERWRALVTEAIVEAKRNTGGSTVTVRVRLASGARALFKPAQRRSVSNHRAEIAAAHLDRLVGFGRVAVVAGRRLPRGALRDHLAAAGAEPAWLARFDEEVRDEAGLVAGALIAWHEGTLVDDSPPRGWTRWLAGARPGADGGTEDGFAAIPDERWWAWSELALFDHLIDNRDRWSGGNVLALKGRGLVFLDNAAGFPRRRFAESPAWELFRKVCAVPPRIRRRLEQQGAPPPAPDRLAAKLERSLASDPLAPVLGEAELAAVDARVARAIEHLRSCAPPPPAAASD